MKPTAAHFKHPRNMSSIRPDCSAGSRSAQLTKGFGVKRPSLGPMHRHSLRSGIEGAAVLLFPCQNPAGFGNALTVIPRFGYARLYEKKISYSLFCSRYCQHLRYPSSIAQSGRVAGKTSWTKES